MSGYWGCFQVRMHLTACLKFCLVMVFLLKFLRLKIYFYNPPVVDQLLFLTLELIVKQKNKNKKKRKKKKRKEN